MPENADIQRVLARMEAEREHLARNGSVFLAWGRYYVLNYRRLDGTKKMFYLGTNPQVVVTARQALEEIQAPAKQARALRRERKRHGMERHRIRSALRGILKTRFNIRLHGCELRRLPSIQA